MPETHPFLSDEWMAAARAIREQYVHQLADGGAPEMRLNQVITDVPFRDTPMELHLDSRAGHMVMEPGHLDEADATVTLDYETAKSVFLEPQNAMAHFMAGKIKVQGDLTKLMGLVQSPENDQSAAEFQRRLADITE